MHVSILDHFRQLNFDLSRSLKVKRNGAIELAYMISYWRLKATYSQTQLLYEI